MAFTPVEVTNGATTRTALTPSQLVQYQYDGWWIDGEAAPGPIPLSERFVFGPTPPSSARAGTVYIPTSA